MSKATGKGKKPNTGEALRIMRECPAALSVVLIMGKVDSDTRRRIFSATMKRVNQRNVKRHKYRHSEV